MEKLFLISFSLISTICYGQSKAVVIDQNTKEPISYVNIWIEDKSIGTSSKLKGEFELSIDSSEIIVFSAIGYKTKRVQSDSIKEIIELESSITKLKEVVVNPKQNNLELIIGSVKKSKIDASFGVETEPWIIARYFPYQEIYKQTPYLNRVKLISRSIIKEAKFNLRFYSVNENGEPGNYLCHENIIGVAKKGKRVTEIDLSDLNIGFPEEGFFIAVEWLIIDENRHEFEYTMEGSNKKYQGVSYEPVIGAVATETDQNSWVYRRGKWDKGWKNEGSIPARYNIKYLLMAIELRLTN